MPGGMYVPVDGDLLENYKWIDVERLKAYDGHGRNLIAQNRWVNPTWRGPEELHELCSQRCQQNPECRGFSVTFPIEGDDWMHHNPSYNPLKGTAQCYLKGDKVKLRSIPWDDDWPQGNSVLRFFYQRTDPNQDEWHYFPNINWNSYGSERDILDNPTLDGRTHAIVALNRSTIPEKMGEWSLLGLDHAFVRFVMRTAFRGGYRSGGHWQSYMLDTSRQTAEFTFEERGHSGDSRIFAPIVRERKSNDEPLQQLVALPEKTPTAELPVADYDPKYATWFRVVSSGHARSRHARAPPSACRACGTRSIPTPLTWPNGTCARIRHASTLIILSITQHTLQQIVPSTHPFTLASPG
jgi:hypothetical protein